MDAILFGPPVYDNTIKGNAAFFTAKMIFRVIFIVFWLQKSFQTSR